MRYIKPKVVLKDDLERTVADADRTLRNIGEHGAAAAMLEEIDAIGDDESRIRITLRKFVALEDNSY